MLPPGHTTSRQRTKWCENSDKEHWGWRVGDCPLTKGLGEMSVLRGRVTASVRVSQLHSLTLWSHTLESASETLIHSQRSLKASQSSWLKVPRKTSEALLSFWITVWWLFQGNPCVSPCQRPDFRELSPPARRRLFCLAFVWILIGRMFNLHTQHHQHLLKWRLITFCLLYVICDYKL